MLLRRMRRGVSVAVLGVVLGSSTVVGATVSTEVARAAGTRSVERAVTKALSYFRSHQTKAGGFAARGMGQAEITPWVVIAIRAAGQDPARWRRKNGKTPVAYLQTVDMERVATAAGPTRNPAATYAKYILAYKAARKTALIARAGKKRVDLVRELLVYQNPATGRFTTSPGGRGTYAGISTTTYAILALRASGRASAARAKAVHWLEGQASADGGFSWNPGGRPDVDSTGAAVQALRAGGVSRSSNVIRRALAFMRGKQQRDGGFAYDTGASTTSSTALAVQGIVAAGQDPGASSWRSHGRTPLQFLLSMQAKDGSFYHLGRIPATPLLSTSHAVMGLKKRPLPL